MPRYKDSFLVRLRVVIPFTFRVTLRSSRSFFSWKHLHRTWALQNHISSKKNITTLFSQISRIVALKAELHSLATRWVRLDSFYKTPALVSALLMETLKVTPFSTAPPFIATDLFLFASALYISGPCDLIASCIMIVTSSKRITLATLLAHASNFSMSLFYSQVIRTTAIIVIWLVSSDQCVRWIL